jgi:hypothetical protein
MRRAVEYTEGDTGIWSLTCAECPLKPHAEALNVKPPRCAGGIATNMPGPMVLDKCQHTDPNSVQNEPGNGLSIECGYARPTPEAKET